MLLSFWTSKRLLIGFIIPYCYLKLDCYGMTGLKGDWFRSYLSSRTQSCAVKTVSWEDICHKWYASGDRIRPLIIFIL